MKTKRESRESGTIKRVVLMIVCVAWALCPGCADLNQNLDNSFRSAFGGFNEQGNWQPGAYSGTTVVVPAR